MTKFKSRSRFTNTSWLHERELGQRHRIDFEDQLNEKLYSSLLPCSSWDHNQLMINKMHGGVYNLEFSQDGSLLVAACEKKSILMFDPISRQLITTVDNAHTDSVNGVRFLDSRTFASCSDDSTVALWDARNLKYKTRNLQGHSNWVKNIEYSAKDDLLVSSGFDGSIYTWDINCYTENSLTYKRVFHTNGLMRTRLSPNAEKMVICTTGGYLIIIHDLNLKTLAHDLQGFKPNMYRLMQLSQQVIPVATSFSHLFSPKRTSNRVEFITDFPPGNEAEVIGSLQIHPMGWCCMSRNVSNDENSEWTCIHDIQEKTAKEFDDFQIETEESPVRPSPSGSTLHIDSESRATILPLESGNSSNSRSSNGSRRNNLDLTVTTADVWEALIAIREARIRREYVNRNPEGHFNFNNMQRISSTVTGILGPQNNSDYNRDDESDTNDQPSSSTSSQSQVQRKKLTRNKNKTTNIYKNIKRLTHFIDEPNVGKGLIKELCFSPDGRVICSPFGYGIRLLAFSPQCHELSTCVPENGPVKLYEVGTNVCHSDIVVSSKFSPKHFLLVTGCLSGKIVWHQPVF